MNPKIAKPLAFLALFAIVIGAGCAIGMNFYANNFIAGACCIVLTIAAIPTVVALFNYLKS